MVLCPSKRCLLIAEIIKQVLVNKHKSGPWHACHPEGMNLQSQPNHPRPPCAWQLQGSLVVCKRLARIHTWACGRSPLPVPMPSSPSPNTKARSW
jgi:hypothetical protein